MKKTLLNTFLMLLLILSFANAENLVIDQTRTIDYSGLGLGIEELVYSGTGDIYVLKTSGNYYRVENNFSTQTALSPTSTSQEFIGFLLDNSVLGSTTYDQTIFEGVGTSSVLALEVNLYGSGSANINTFDLNDVTPAAYEIIDHDGIVFNEETLQLYVLQDNTQSINVYRVEKPNLYDYTFIRNFPLEVDCGYTHNQRIDLDIYQDRLYLLCGDKGQNTKNTIYSYSLTGDLRDNFTLNVANDDFHSTAVYEINNEFVTVDRDADDLEFFEFKKSPLEEVLAIGGQLYNSSSVCIESSECDNATFTLDQFGSIIWSCQGNTNYCSDGCDEVYNGQIIEAQCNQLACSNECNTPNAITCETPNTYSVCQLAQSGCLELTSGLFCPANFVCETQVGNDACSGVNITQTGLYTQPFINVDLDINNTNAFEVLETTIEQGVQISTLPITTTFGVGIQSLSALVVKSIAQVFFQEIKITGVSELQPTQYSAVSCDFTNNVLEQDYLSHNDLVGNGWSTQENISNINESLYFLDISTNATKTLENTVLSQELEIMVENLDNGTSTISFYDNPYLLSSLEIVYDNVTLELLIRETTYNKLLVNETGILIDGSDTLRRIVLINTFIKDSDTYTLSAIVIREVNDIETEQIYYSLPIAYSNNVGNTPDTINFAVEEGTLRVYQIIQREQDGFGIYSQNTTQECEYTTLTCHNQRFWANTQQITSYHFYEDLNTCVQSLGGVSTTDENLGVNTDDGELDFFENILGRSLSSNQKLLLATVITTLIFGVFAYGYIESRESIMLVGGTILAGLMLFWFSVIGYVPAWIIFLLIVIGGFIAVTFRRGGN